MGSAIYFEQSYNISLSNISLSSNKAVYGGSVSALLSDSISCSELNVKNNIALNEGGGIYLMLCKYISIQSSEIKNNSVNYSGGGIITY